MKEIDFLPQWYKNDKRQQFSYRTQYVALAGIFVVMVVWNFTAAYSISRAKAGIAQMATKQAEAERTLAKMEGIKSEVTYLRRKVKSIEEIDSKIDVAGVLAEMSFLIDERVVLGKVRFIAEKFEDKQQAESNVISAVRVAGIKINDRGKLPVGSVRFKVLISGVAADASDVADLVCKLEESPYFCNVIPLFSRNKQVQRGNNPARRNLNSDENVSYSEESFRVSEFEISCYLANYLEQ
jgi:Tfp pilus assembly protein PilN